MLKRPPPPPTDRSPRSQQEHRLLDELQRIDHRLRANPPSALQPTAPNICPLPVDQEHNGSGEWGNYRAELVLPIGNGYSDYFS